ncbi:MAG: DNA mismatch repair protein MutS, partial [Pyrinomonadaceae bacterium]
MENTTPMLRQYLEIKKNYPGTILFFRLGDFYEMFNEDAIVGARELEITLTARQKDSPNPLPMCGVPHHAAAGYIAKLVKKGYRVAICEQAEAAGKGVKLVKREVVRVITPGTAIDSQLTDSRESNYLSAVSASGDRIGIAFLEFSTGSFQATEFVGSNAWQKTVEQIESFAPRELLFTPDLTSRVQSSFSSKNAQPLLADAVRPSGSSGMTLTEVEESLDSTGAGELLSAHFKTQDVAGFGFQDHPEATRAAAICLEYAKRTQKASVEHISEISYYDSSDFMVLDAATLRNLDLVDARSDNNKHTLLKVIDETITS